MLLLFAVTFGKTSHLWTPFARGQMESLLPINLRLENPMDGGAWWATVHGVAEWDTTERLHYLRGITLTSSGWTVSLEEVPLVSNEIASGIDPPCRTGEEWMKVGHKKNQAPEGKSESLTAEAGEGSALALESVGLVRGGDSLRLARSG